MGSDKSSGALNKCFLPVLWHSRPANGSGVTLGCSSVGGGGGLEVREVSEDPQLPHGVVSLVLPRSVKIKGLHRNNSLPSLSF